MVEIEKAKATLEINIIFCYIYCRIKKRILNMNNTQELNIPDRFKRDIEKAIKILKSFNCEEIYIFGSLVTGKYHDTSDIDIAMKGIKPELFFDIYSEFRLSGN